jgi:hypothetical protein
MHIPVSLKYRLLLVVILINGLLSQAIAMDATILCQNLRCFDVPEGIIAVNITSGQPDFLFLLFSDSLMRQEVQRSKPTAELSHSFTALKAGKYTVKIINNKGESFVKQVVLSQPAQLFPGKIIVEKPLSNAGSTDASIRANPSGGSPPYNYQWKGNTSPSTTSILCNLGLGTYVCEITDASGCGPVRATCFLQFQTSTGPSADPSSSGHDNSINLNTQ